MMFHMSGPEKFQIELGGGALCGALQRPANSIDDSPNGAVLICRGVRSLDEDGHTLLDALTDALCARGLAVARFEHRCADLILDDFDAHSAAHDIEDALAVHRWLTSWTHVDPDRIGVLGYSLGGIAAAAITARASHVSRLCLLAAPTAAYLAHAIIKHNGRSGLVGDGELPRAFVESLDSMDSARDAASHSHPSFVVHGAADRFVEPVASMEYVAALEAAGRPFEHILIARGDHTFAMPPARAAAIEIIAGFFTALAAHPEPAMLAKSGI